MTLIIPSGRCPGEWLAAHLRPGPLGGGWAILYDPQTQDARPVREWLDLWSGYHYLEPPTGGPS